MAKLFIAIDVPTATSAELVRIQPTPIPGMRLVEPAQMHVTLHFLGEAEPKALMDDLQELSLPAFEIHLEGVGQFRSPTGAIRLWAGVRKSPELLSLHLALADALRRRNIATEERDYTPHVTLARYEGDVPEHIVTDFLARNRMMSTPAAPIVRFGLYSSTSVNGVPRYECVRSIPLQPTECDWAVHRQDDNGNRFVVSTGLRREEAERIAAEFEARDHKQLYWVERAGGN
jgi:2'-5' RNA ligase